VTAELLITRLVQEAPALDPRTLAELQRELERDGRPLALSIARVAMLVGEQRVDPAIALPALAEAIATLAATDDPRVLEAARYQVETLQPVPARPPPPLTPDVPIAAVKRRP
jgi:hypothetical protein